MGNDNLDLKVECTYCGSQVAYKDLYDNLAYMCSKECRLKFNDEYKEKWDLNLERKKIKYRELAYIT
jgi:endogenous inhibitor of DNA gyrase (YacG/DUF329 family)